MREEYQVGGEEVGRKGGGLSPCGGEREKVKEALEDSGKGFTGLKAELEKIIF